MPNPGARARRWLTADTQRLLNRARASNHGAITDCELAYLHSWCHLLLGAPVELPDHSRGQIEQLYRDVQAALTERAAERSRNGGR
jgi:hypothetical protein